MTDATPDLFGFVASRPMLVRLERSIDRERPCCGNVAVVLVRADTIHAAELRCAGCDKHRGWLPKVALDFLQTTAARFGAPSEPIVLRDRTIGDTVMANKEYDNTNRGALFRDADKSKETDRDYGGTLNVEGTEYWLSGFVKTSKAGKKYLALTVKPKETLPVKSGKSIGADMADSIPFAAEWR